MLDMKSYLALFAIFLVFIGYIPYFRDTFLGKTKPHMFSWFIWGLTSLIAFGIQLSSGGGAGAYVNAVMTVICFALAVLGMRNGFSHLTRGDFVSLFLAILAITLWLVVAQPVLSIILVITIDFLSFLPTILKTWKRPREETAALYAVSAVRHAVTISAFESLTFLTVAYPFYALLANVFFLGMMFGRRKKV